MAGFRSYPARPYQSCAVRFCYTGIAWRGLLLCAPPAANRIYSEKLGVFTVIAWNITACCGSGQPLLGYTQGREYAEMIWPIDIMVVIAFCLVFINLVMTVKNRRGTGSLCVRLVCPGRYYSDRHHLLHSAMSSGDPTVVLWWEFPMQFCYGFTVTMFSGSC